MSGEMVAKLPNAMTYKELIDSGKSPADAQRILRERVFGVGHPTAEDGKPVEIGLGSLHQQKHHPELSGPHKAALAREGERKAMMGGGAAINADVISAAVAAGVQAGLAAGKDGGVKKGKAAMKVDDL